MRWIAWLPLVAALAPETVSAYPIDGYGHTGIRRLDYSRRAQAGAIPGALALPAGQLWPLDAVDIRHPDGVADLPPPDEGLSADITRLLGDNAEHYGVSVLDISDPERPVYGEHNDGYLQNIGSVGKLPVALAVFHELARAWPDSLDDRMRVLRAAQITADKIIRYDDHAVVLWDPARRHLRRRPLQPGDQASLWEYLDWMLSASSNAAAAMVMKHLIAMRHFGAAYPPDAKTLATFWASASPASRGKLFAEAMDDAVVAAGLNPGRLRQGSVFTHEGKVQVAGRPSYGTPRELVRLLYRMERGELIDAFSSRELKRLMYMTQKRIRYASHPALDDAAVYFKTGSLYTCRPEPRYACGKYAGNQLNILASVAIVETGPGPNRLHYLVAVVSNVLRRNSAVDHQTLAGRLHKLIRRRHAGEESVDD